MVPTVFRFLFQFLRGLAAVHPRAWLLCSGLVMTWFGAEAFAPGAGFLVCGLLIVWDSTRDLSKK